MPNFFTCERSVCGFNPRCRGTIDLLTVRRIPGKGLRVTVGLITLLLGVLALSAAVR